MSDGERVQDKPEMVEESDSSDSSYDEEVPEPPKEKEDSTLLDDQKPVEKMAHASQSAILHPGQSAILHPGQSAILHRPQSTMLQQPQPRRKRFIPKYDIEGVYRLELSEETQLVIECVVGNQVSSQFPWTFVQKDKLLESLELTYEQSELWPLKSEIEAYPEPLVLMGYVADETRDEDEFYICLTVQARDHCKQQSDKFTRRQEKKLEKRVHKKAGKWIGFGSEFEVQELKPENTRSLMEIEIKTTFPTLYDPEKFHVRDTNACRDGLIELTPYRQKFNNVYMRRVDAEVQAALSKQDRAAQTELRYPQNMWTQSIADAMGKFEDPGAGGDRPKEIEAEDDNVIKSSSDEEEEKKEPEEDVGLLAYKAAYRRLRRVSYQRELNGFVHNKIADMVDVLELNTVMDMYFNDYSNLAAENIVDIYDSMIFEEYICFTDVRAKDKYVSCAVFHPMWSGILAICYSDGSPNVMKTLGTRPDPIQRAVYGLNPVMIWSHIDSLLPKLYLESPREVKTLAFCPFDENLLIGGCINGQIVIWDLTNKLENVETIENLGETREKYRIAMNDHMGWMKPVQDIAVVPATALSNLLTSHYGSVNTLKWFSPNYTVTQTGVPMLMTHHKKSLMFCSGSEDGTILIWNLSVENVTAMDGRKVKKSKRVLKRPSGLMQTFSKYKILDRNLMPCYKVIIGIAGHPQTMPIQDMSMIPPPVNYIHAPRWDGKGRKYFKCTIQPQKGEDYDTTIYCGSQHGEVQKLAWEGHAFNTGEVVNSEYCDLKFSCNIHDGIIFRTSQNPFLKDVQLTVGGKIFAIWHDKFPGRPLIWKKRPCRLTDAVWSLYKPSLLFISTSDGSLETWDLLLKSSEPLAIQTVSGSMLTGVSLHTLPLPQNIIGVSDMYGSFRMFLKPPIFMIENKVHVARMETMIERELTVMNSFIAWQTKWMENNQHILLEMKRKEGALLEEKEEQKRKQREAEEKRIEEEEEIRMLAKMKVIGPQERWQRIIQRLIERTIAVKKRINKAELIEHEKPLRELEAQRLEKERRMLDIMKNQKAIFNDTVAILFPEAIKKPPKPKKSYLNLEKGLALTDYLEEYEALKVQAFKTVRENPYKVEFSWETTVTEGKERREALNADDHFINMHKIRLREDGGKSYVPHIIEEPEIEEEEEEEEAAENA